MNDSPMKDRKIQEFEAWCASKGISIQRRADGRYHINSVNAAYQVWEVAFDAGRRAERPRRSI